MLQVLYFEKGVSSREQCLVQWRERRGGGGIGSMETFGEMHLSCLNRLSLGEVENLTVSFLADE